MRKKVDHIEGTTDTYANAMNTMADILKSLAEAGLVTDAGLEFRLWYNERYAIWTYFIDRFIEVLS